MGPLPCGGGPGGRCSPGGGTITPLSPASPRSLRPGGHLHGPHARRPVVRRTGAPLAVIVAARLDSWHCERAITRGCHRPVLHHSVPAVT